MSHSRPGPPTFAESMEMKFDADISDKILKLDEKMRDLGLQKYLDKKKTARTPRDIASTGNSMHNFDPSYPQRSVDGSATLKMPLNGIDLRTDARGCLVYTADTMIKELEFARVATIQGAAQGAHASAGALGDLFV